MIALEKQIVELISILLNECFSESLNSNINNSIF